MNAQMEQYALCTSLETITACFSTSLALWSHGSMTLGSQEAGNIPRGIGEQQGGRLNCTPRTSTHQQTVCPSTDQWNQSIL